MASRKRPTSTTSENESRSAAGSSGEKFGLWPIRVAQFPEPFEGGGFDGEFFEGHLC